MPDTYTFYFLLPLIQIADEYETMIIWYYVLLPTIL